MKYWLMKSEPDEFSITDLENRYPASEAWNGIRNYQARNYIRDDIRCNDQILFYHSSCKTPGVAGLMQVTREAYPDHTALQKDNPYFDSKSSIDKPKWFMIDVIFLRKFPKVVELREMRKHQALAGMKLLQKGNRLSVMPVEKIEFDYILQLADSLL